MKNFTSQIIIGLIVLVVGAIMVQFVNSNSPECYYSLSSPISTKLIDSTTNNVQYLEVVNIGENPAKEVLVKIMSKTRIAVMEVQKANTIDSFQINLLENSEPAVYYSKLKNDSKFGIIILSDSPISTKDVYVSYDGGVASVRDSKGLFERYGGLVMPFIYLALILHQLVTTIRRSEIDSIKRNRYPNFIGVQKPWYLDAKEWKETQMSVAEKSFEHPYEDDAQKFLSIAKDELNIDSYTVKAFLTNKSNKVYTGYAIKKIEHYFTKYNDLREYGNHPTNLSENNKAEIEKEINKKKIAILVNNISTSYKDVVEFLNEEETKKILSDIGNEDNKVLEEIILSKLFFEVINKPITKNNEEILNLFEITKEKLPFIQESNWKRFKEFISIIATINISRNMIYNKDIASIYKADSMISEIGINDKFYSNKHFFELAFFLSVLRYIHNEKDVAIDLSKLTHIDDIRKNDLLRVRKSYNLLGKANQLAQSLRSNIGGQYFGLSLENEDFKIFEEEITGKYLKSKAIINLITDIRRDFPVFKLEEKPLDIEDDTWNLFQTFFDAIKENNEEIEKERSSVQLEKKNNEKAVIEIRNRENDLQSDKNNLRSEKLSIDKRLNILNLLFSRPKEILKIEDYNSPFAEANWESIQKIAKTLTDNDL
jgi:hypothetical protein